MSGVVSDVSGFVLNWLNKLGITSTYTGLQWALIQFLVIFVAFAVALMLDRWLSPRLEAYVRNIKGQPQLLRALAIILRRMRWIFLTVVLWVSVEAMQSLTWISRSYLVGIAAQLCTAWVII